MLGKFTLDLPNSPQAAEIKGIKSPVAGRAQILVVSDLEAGNMLAKNLTFLSNADAAGSCSARACPSFSPFRADSVRSRMASCVVAVLYAHARRTNAPLPAA
jgi:phosphate acetyltransferase